MLREREDRDRGRSKGRKVGRREEGGLYYTRLSKMTSLP